MKIVRVGLIAIVLFYILMMPQAMIFQDFFHRKLDSVLKLKIKESYNGGEVLTSFKDRLNDDNGAGLLTYPRASIYKNGGAGLLDIVKFTVYRPQAEEDWSSDNIYWQFKYKFQNLVGSNNGRLVHPVITHYIGINGVEFEGKSETLISRNERVSFSRPWHFVIEIFEDKALIHSADGSLKEEIKIMISENQVITRVSLENKFLKHLFTNPETYHYVLTGAYDFYSEGKFLNVKKKASSKNGGGATSRLTPRVYDLIAPKGYKQKELLSSFNEDDFKYTLLEPVIADLGMEYKEELKVEFPDKESLIVKSKLESDIKNEEAIKEHNELLLSLEGKDDINSIIQLGKSYFNTGDLEEALKYLENALNIDKNNPIVLAYMGSVRAKEAGETDSAAKSMDYVNKAFVFYDRALENINSIDEEMEVLLNRAYVAQSVPESVFYKSELGAKDFLRVIDICNLSGKSQKIQHYYLMASICFKQAGKYEESDIYLNEALEMGTLSSSDMLMLMETK